MNLMLEPAGQAGWGECHDLPNLASSPIFIDSFPFLLNLFRLLLYNVIPTNFLIFQPVLHKLKLFIILAEYKINLKINSL